MTARFLLESTLPMSTLTGAGFFQHRTFGKNHMHSTVHTIRVFVNWGETDQPSLLWWLSVLPLSSKSRVMFEPETLAHVVKKSSSCHRITSVISNRFAAD